MIHDLGGWPKQLREIEETRRNAMYGADVKTLCELLHDDLVYLHSNGLRDGKASHLATIGSGAARYVVLTSSGVESIGLSTDVWLITGRLNGEVVAKGQTFGIDAVFTSVWWKDLRWRMVSWQSTPWPRTG